MKQTSTLLLLCAAITSTVSATSGHKQPVRHRREFSSPTAVPRVAKRQNTLAQLQEALDHFLATANGTSTSSHLTSVPSSDPVVDQVPAAATDNQPATTTTAIPTETSAQTSDPASIVIGASPDAPSSSSTTNPKPTLTDVAVDTSSSSKVVPTSRTDTPETTAEAPATIKTSTTTEGGLGGILSSVLVGEPATFTSEEASTTKPKPTSTEIEISITIEDPETTTTSKKPVTDEPQTTAVPATTSTKPVQITIGLPNPVTTTTRKVESSSTPDDITIGEPETTTRREPVTTTTSADETSITIAPEPETTTRREPETTTSTKAGGISISIDLPTIIPSSRPGTTDKPSTKEATSTKAEQSSTRDEPKPPQTTDNVSITISLPSEDPKPSRSSTQESSSPTKADPSTDGSQPSHTTSHGGISISIGLPSIVPNVTDIVSTSRPGPTERPSSDLASSGQGSQTSLTDIIPSSRPASGGNQTTAETAPSSGGSAQAPVASSSRGSFGGNVTESAGASAIQSGNVSLSTEVAGNITAPSASLSSSRPAESSSEIDTATKTPNSFYNFVPTSTLMVNTDSQATTTIPPTSATGPILSGNSAADESISSITLATALPSSLPAKIVPGNAPASIPEDSTLVSLMFAQVSMGWLWVVQSPDTAAQVLAYMPQLLATSLNISESDIQSTALVAYQSLTDTSAKQLMTVYLASLPSDQVANLQAQVKTPSSSLYQQNAAILQQLSQQLVATFPVTAFTSTEQATIGVDADGDGSSGGDDNKKKNTTVIAVVASFGSVIILLLAFVAFRYVRRNKNGAPNLRALQLGRNPSNSPISSPQMQQASNRNVFSGLFTSHHYASSPESRRSYGSDSSGHSSAHSIGGNNREVQRGISWYSGRYTDFGEDENGSPRSRSVYGQAITQDSNSPANPFGDRHASADSDEAAWLSRSEGVRRLKTGQVQISRPQLEGNSLML